MSYPILTMDIEISALTSKCQTVIPKAIRAKMGLKPGDRIRYKVKGKKVEIEKLEMADDWGLAPLAYFTEWASPQDDATFAHLQMLGDRLEREKR